METTAIRRPNPLTVLLTSQPVVLLFRFLLGGLFVFSAWGKIVDPHGFAIAVRGYKLLPVELTNLFALGVAWAEFLSGVMLILGIMTRQAAAAVFLLLSSFAIAIVSTMVRGMVVDCGCFSNEGGSQTGIILVIRNLFLMAVALIIMRHGGTTWGLARLFKRPSSPTS